MHLGTSENANVAEETKIDEGALENSREGIQSTVIMHFCLVSRNDLFFY